MGVETYKEAKEMKKRFAKLTRSAQTNIEAEYHRMKPEELDAVMSHSKHYSPDAIRLSPRLVRKLKTVAESEGEPEYRTMVQRWVEERLRRTTRRASSLLENR